MSKRIVQIQIQNTTPSLKEFERMYLPALSNSRARKAGGDLLALVHKHCSISPIDATITYPNGETSFSTLGQLLQFFACGDKVSEMPPDALTFLAFLKSQKFPTNTLCMIKMDQ